MKKGRVGRGNQAGLDLPDYSTDWQLPEASVSNAEIEARIYYEFARESQTILRITEKLRHFSRGEKKHRVRQRTLSDPALPLADLHPRCFTVACALMPKINLQKVGWNR